MAAVRDWQRSRGRRLELGSRHAGAWRAAGAAVQRRRWGAPGVCGALELDPVVPMGAFSPETAHLKVVDERA